MAKHLARIHGTEEDKVNCPFYFKIGACRHSDRCSRLHHKPAFSPTILIKHIYRHPSAMAMAVGGLSQPSPAAAASNNPDQAMEDFLVFFEDMFMELSKFGRIEGLHVVDNVGDHMIGHVYVKFSDEEEAADAIEKLHGRYYDGILLDCEYSPVTDFREARCRDYDEETCSRAGFCNFLHVKPVPMALIRSLQDDTDTQRRLLEQEKEDERRLLKKSSSKHSHSHSKKDRSSSKRKSSSRGEEGSKKSKRSRRSRSQSSTSSAESEE